MSKIQPAVAYTPVAKFFHWGMALLWIVAWALGFTAAHGGKALNPDFVLTFLHKSVASTIVFLTVFRLFWRFGHSPPALPATMSPLTQLFAHFGHLLLYAVALIALPISGWLLSSFAGKPILLAGFIHLPLLTEPDKALVATARLVHNYTAWFCGLMVLGHILAALKHHFIDRDDILMRMKWR
ncbi:cytochrome b [uncultured Rhodoblastus sp.]|uniref:cytochrome b n=1 Tax=uncultured Rhodoblastus sp. TaxID=543037 RepID=UPI0025F95826|nr:cytochrome b [uncultured Rhodoblastus sp.]